MQCLKNFVFNTITAIDLTYYTKNKYDKKQSIKHIKTYNSVKQ